MLRIDVVIIRSLKVSQLITYIYTEIYVIK